MAAIQQAIELGVKELKIYYDYEGIEKWASGEWKANKALTKFYSGYIAAAKNVITIEFEHVKAHTGIDGNEEADRLAKEAVGLQLKQNKLFRELRLRRFYEAYFVPLYNVYML